VAVLAAVALRNVRRGRLSTLERFVTGGRDASAATLSFSLLSLVFGASAVFGMAGYAYTAGARAIWWTLSGMIGLLLLRAAFVDTLVDLKGHSVSDLAARVFGERVRAAVAVATATAWLMILAGQIVAGGAVLETFVGDGTASCVLFTASFAVYTLFAGQEGALRTGPFQTLLMAAGLSVLLAACLSALPPSAPPLSFRIGFDRSFPPSAWAAIAVPVALSYLFGPDVFSRIFSARDREAARRGLLLAVAGMALLSAAIVLIGLAARPLLGEVKNPDALFPLLVSRFLDGVPAKLVVLSLVSIPLSGADVMLLTIGTLLGKEIAGRLPGGKGREGGAEGARGVAAVRLAIALGAVAALLVALRLKAILPSLLVAYRIFSVSVVPLIFVSLLCLKAGRVVPSPRARRLVGAYLVASAALVLAVELKLFLPEAPKTFSLWLVAANALFLLVLARFASEAAPARAGEGVR
jgi:SSS family solute:Na+ symporter